MEDLEHKKTPHLIYVDEETWQRFKYLARSTGRIMSSVMEGLLENWVSDMSKAMESGNLEYLPGMKTIHVPDEAEKNGQENDIPKP